MKKKLMKKKRFSLIELLVVIAIIAILMGILFPALNAVRRQAKKTKAKSEMNAIITAVKQYEQDYGTLPWGGASDVLWENQTNEDDEYDTVMQILTKVDMTAGDATNKADLGNARKIAFLDAPTNFETKGYLDPWENRYALGMDLDYDEKVTINSIILNGTVFLYSFGPDKTDDNGENDDICSWK